MCILLNRFFKDDLNKKVVYINRLFQLDPCSDVALQSFLYLYEQGMLHLS